MKCRENAVEKFEEAPDENCWSKAEEEVKTRRSGT